MNKHSLTSQSWTQAIRRRRDRHRGFLGHRRGFYLGFGGTGHGSRFWSPVRQDRLAALAAAIEAKHGVRAVTVPTDLALPDCAERIRAGVEAAGLTVGLLVNNAGYGLFGHFIDHDPADQAAMVDRQLPRAASLARMFAPDMKARGRGGIIFVASTAAYQPTPYMATYAATKVFDLFLAEALWAELAGHGVEVLALSPGHVRTGFQARSGDPIRNPPGGVSTTEAIVATALAAWAETVRYFRPAQCRHDRTDPPDAPNVVMHSAIRYFDRISQCSPRGSLHTRLARCRRPGQRPRQLVRPGLFVRVRLPGGRGAAGEHRQESRA